MVNHEEKMEKNAVNFLLYTYFENVIDDLQDEKGIINTAIERAFKDATLQGAYNTLISKKDSKLRSKSNDAYKAATDLLKERIEDFLDEDKDYLEIHENTCKDLVDEYCDIKKNGKPCFTPGNAQKWVNMTMKNLYVICGILMACGYDKPVKNLCEKVLKRASCFQIPVDSYILEAWEDIPNKDASYISNGSDGIRIKYKKDGDGNCKLSNDDRKILKTAWSAMEDYKIYDDLQDKCAKQVLSDEEWPIEWESSKWIEIAKRRKRS